MRTLVILGSTGSVGTQALDVVRRNPDRFRVLGLSAGTNHELLVGQVREFLPPQVAIADEEAANDLREKIGTVRGVDILTGPDAAETLARESEADMVLNALVGSVGLAPTLATLQSGKILALANKESLIVGGELVMDLIKGEPERLVPVDSEHAGLAQCLRGERREDLKRVIVTGSGGPFRGWTRAELAKASVKEALTHPVWQMGPKITIDSATLMNKGLEVIEARWLFDVGPERVDVVVHPQSIVHSLVEFRDTSVIAQLGLPDMRVPIAVALAHPERLPLDVPRLDLAAVGRLDFETPDTKRFPCLELAYQALRGDEAAPAVLNAANEVAVEAFLSGGMAFPAIAAANAAVLEAFEKTEAGGALRDLDDATAADTWARARAREWLAAHPGEGSRA